MKLIHSIFSPQESVNDEFLSVLTVMVKSGDKIYTNTLLAELETSKAIVEIHSEKEGFVKVHINAGTDVKVGSLLFEIFDSEIEKKDIFLKAELKNVNEDFIPSSNYIKTRFSKLAAEYMLNNNIDESTFSGSSFITTKDLIKNQSNLLEKSGKIKTAENTKELNQSSKEIKPLSSAKKREFDYLYSVNSSSVISRLSTSIKVKNKKNIEAAQIFIKTSPLPSIIHEVAKLLLKYPNLNSFYKNGEQAFYNVINVGFALDDGNKGLKVASIYKTDNLSLQEIEEIIADISVKYTNQQLTVQDLTSSTFTITDLFTTSVTSFHPLVNSNNSAILGISGYENSQFNIDISFDHRITNGREVADFLTDLKFRLENRFNNLFGNENSGIICIKCLRDINDDMKGSIFFQKVINSKGEGYICSNCLIGI